MMVKWHNVMSSTKNLPGGGPQGTSLGIWSYLSQTNDNPEGADQKDIFKFVDLILLCWNNRQVFDTSFILKVLNYN